MDTSYNQTGLYCSKEVALIWALPILTILAILAIIIRTVSIKKHNLSSKDTTSNLQLAAPYCSPSSSSSPPTWDVFLSFYGKDTRTNFTSHLYSALDQAGFLTFRDDPALEKGQEISSALLDAIRSSKIFIVVVSENYARSPWCLNELVHILSCNRTEIHVVPVFYYVDPSDVRYHKGSFGKALDGHKKRYSVDMIVKWKSALSKIAELSGHHLRKEANEQKDYKVTDVESGIRKLKQILHSKKALIILDDLDQSNYSELVANLSDLFSPGSRIIITTRDANLLNKVKVDMAEVDMYMVKTLEENDSLELFSYHAFRKPVPPENFRKLSLSFVTYAGGLPLALKVLGSSLLGRTCEFWKAKLEKVQEISENDIQEILKLSYDELDETEKAIFLDIAFFFVGKDKDEAVNVFKSCDFFPGVGIAILLDKCLLTIDSDTNKFEMHSLIQDMGRKLGKSTRLFLRGNAWKDLQNVEGRNDIEGLVLDLTTSTTHGQATTFLFERMPNLRLLQIIGAPHIKGNFKNLFPNLRCIRWHSCPWTHIPSTFRPHNLVSLDMPSSKFKILWKGPMPIKQLNNLGCLYLRNCQDLKRLPEQLGDMKALKKIDTSDTAIEKLPDSITRLKELVELNLNSCRMLTQLPEQLGRIKRLKKLNAASTAIKQLPDSITQLKELFVLKVSGCKKLRKLPEQIGNMESLSLFHARNGAIEQLPDSFVSLINLEDLDLGWCENLRNLPKDIWKLKLLKGLSLAGCSNLEQLPEQLGKMQCLERLNASHTAIEQVPDSTGLLGRLQSLYLSDCKKLRYVPPSIWNLCSIEDLSIHPGDTGWISLPDSVKNMKKLKYLHLRCNVRLCLPIILCFSSLERLTLTDEGQILSSAKPFSLSELFNLRYLELRNCTSLGSSLPELPMNLEKLLIINHISLEQLPDLLSLRKLKYLYVEGCISLRSISLLPSHLRSLSVVECTSLQELPDLSMLKELERLSFTRCNNLKSISLEESFLHVGQHRHPFEAHLPNREVAEWFDYKSRGCTVSFDITPSFGSNFLGLALWVVYTCKATKETWTYMRAVITNDTEGITENYPIEVHTRVGEAKSSVTCITGEKISMKSGDRIKVSIPSLLYSDYRLRVPVGREVKVKMFGVHVIQK